MLYLLKLGELDSRPNNHRCEEAEHDRENSADLNAEYLLIHSFLLIRREILYYASSASSEDILRHYHRETRLLRLKLLGKCLKRPWMYLPALRALVMKSGIGSTKKEGGV